MIPPDRISDAFAYQATSCESLGSAFMGRLMRLCATQDWPAGAVQDRIFGWAGDITPRGQSVPLRLAGALHALHLQKHQQLSPVYPPHDSSDSALWGAVRAALLQDEGHIMAWLDSPPQTNEVRRAATLIAVGQLLSDRFGLPLRTSELGASGGLNLHWDAYAMDVQGQRFGSRDPALVLQPDWTGPLPPVAAIRVTDRAGVDINPLNPSNPDHAMRLMAYLWPDQPERLALTRAAIKAARTPVIRSDAIDWLAGRLAHQEGTAHLIYSTVAWQYFPQEKQAEGARMIAAHGASATSDAPLAWFGMENDGGQRGAALTLRLWPGDITLDLGRADFHGRWIAWRHDHGSDGGMH